MKLWSDLVSLPIPAAPLSFCWYCRRYWEAHYELQWLVGHPYNR